MPILGPLGETIVGHTKEGRPIVRNPDGTVSTERTETIELDGHFLNIPTMFGGKAVSVDEAIAILRKAGWKDPDTKQPIRRFGSLQEAVRAAESRTKALDAEIRSRGF